MRPALYVPKTYSPLSPYGYARTQGGDRRHRECCSCSTLSGCRKGREAHYLLVRGATPWEGGALGGGRKREEPAPLMRPAESGRTWASRDVLERDQAARCRMAQTSCSCRVPPERRRECRDVPGRSMKSRMGNRTTPHSFPPWPMNRSSRGMRPYAFQASRRPYPPPASQGC